MNVNRTEMRTVHRQRVEVEAAWREFTAALREYDTADRKKYEAKRRYDKAVNLLNDMLENA